MDTNNIQKTYDNLKLLSPNFNNKFATVGDFQTYLQQEGNVEKTFDNLSKLSSNFKNKFSTSSDFKTYLGMDESQVETPSLYQSFVEQQQTTPTYSWGIPQQKTQESITMPTTTREVRHDYAVAATPTTIPDVQQKYSDMFRTSEEGDKMYNEAETKYLEKANELAKEFYNTSNKNFANQEEFLNAFQNAYKDRLKTVQDEVFKDYNETFASTYGQRIIDEALEMAYNGADTEGVDWLPKSSVNDYILEGKYKNLNKETIDKDKLRREIRLRLKNHNLTDEDKRGLNQAQISVGMYDLNKAADALVKYYVSHEDNPIYKQYMESLSNVLAKEETANLDALNSRIDMMKEQYKDKKQQYHTQNGVSVTIEGYQTTDEGKRLDYAKQIYDEANDIIKAPKKYEDGTFKGARDFFNGLGHVATTKDFWTFGFASLADNKKFVQPIIDKLERNGNDISKLTDAEQEIVRALEFKGRTSAALSGAINNAYRGGEIAGESIPFMIEFALTDGIANLASGGSKLLIKKGIGKASAKAAEKITAKTGRELIEDFAETGLRNASVAIDKTVFDHVLDMTVGSIARMPLMPSTYSSMLSEMSDKISFDQEGKAIVEDGANFWRALYDTGMEVVSEGSGWMIDMPIGKFFTRLERRIPKNFGRISMQNVPSFAQLYNLSSVALRKAGIGGIGGELFEEIFKNGVDFGVAALTKDKEWIEQNKQFWDKDNLEQMIIGFSALPIVGGVKTAIGLPIAIHGENKSSRAFNDVLTRFGFNEEERNSLFEKLNTTAIKDIMPMLEAEGKRKGLNNTQIGEIKDNATSLLLNNAMFTQYCSEGYEFDNNLLAAVKDNDLAKKLYRNYNLAYTKAFRLPNGKMNVVTLTDGTVGFISGYEVGEDGEIGMRFVTPNGIARIINQEEIASSHMEEFDEKAILELSEKQYYDGMKDGHKSILEKYRKLHNMAVEQQRTEQPSSQSQQSVPSASQQIQDQSQETETTNPVTQEIEMEIPIGHDKKKIQIKGIKGFNEDGSIDFEQGATIKSGGRVVLPKNSDYALYTDAINNELRRRKQAEVSAANVIIQEEEKAEKEAEVKAQEEEAKQKEFDDVLKSIKYKADGTPSNETTPEQIVCLWLSENGEDVTLSRIIAIIKDNDSRLMQLSKDEKIGQEKRFIEEDRLNKSTKGYIASAEKWLGADAVVTIEEERKTVLKEPNSIPIVNTTGQNESIIPYGLSDEIDENGKQFVLTSNGDIQFGQVDGISGLIEAPIMLSEGMITNPGTNDGYGLVHIEARHGNQIRKAGYKSVVDFIEDVAKNYEIIKQGNDRQGNKTYLLQLKDKHNNTLIVELSTDGKYWNINTAGIFKESYGSNRKEVYRRHTTANQSTETDEASRNGEQSGTQPNPSMNTPITSDGKDTINNSNDQIIQEKNEENNEISSNSEGIDLEADDIVLLYQLSSGRYAIARKIEENGETRYEQIWNASSRGNTLVNGSSKQIRLFEGDKEVWREVPKKIVYDYRNLNNPLLLITNKPFEELGKAQNSAKVVPAYFTGEGVYNLPLSYMERKTQSGTVRVFPDKKRKDVNADKTISTAKTLDDVLDMVVYKNEDGTIIFTLRDILAIPEIVKDRTTSRSTVYEQLAERFFANRLRTAKDEESARDQAKMDMAILTKGMNTALQTWNKLVIENNLDEQFKALIDENNNDIAEAQKELDEITAYYESTKEKEKKQELKKQIDNKKKEIESLQDRFYYYYLMRERTAQVQDKAAEREKDKGLAESKRNRAAKIRETISLLMPQRFDKNEAALRIMSTIEQMKIIMEMASQVQEEYGDKFNMLDLSLMRDVVRNEKKVDIVKKDKNVEAHQQKLADALKDIANAATVKELDAINNSKKYEDIRNNEDFKRAFNNKRHELYVKEENQSADMLTEEEMKKIEEEKKKRAAEEKSENDKKALALLGETGMKVLDALPKEFNLLELAKACKDAGLTPEVATFVGSFRGRNVNLTRMQEAYDKLDGKITKTTQAETKPRRQRIQNEQPTTETSAENITSTQDEASVAEPISDQQALTTTEEAHTPQSEQKPLEDIADLKKEHKSALADLQELLHSPKYIENEKGEIVQDPAYKEAVVNARAHIQDIIKRMKENSVQLDVETEDFTTSEASAKAIVDTLVQAGIPIVRISEKSLGQYLSDKKIKEIKDNKGVVRGFAKGNTIYLVEEMMNPTTPVHEYTHLWVTAFAMTNKKEWDKYVRALKRTNMWKTVVANGVYQDIKDNEQEIASEVMSRLTGARYGAITNEEGQSYFEQVKNGTMEDQLANTSAMDIVRKIWYRILDWFGIKNITDEYISEIINRPIKDLLERAKTIEYLNNNFLGAEDFNADGTIKDSVLEEIAAERRKIIADAKANGIYMLAPNGNPTNLTEDEWVTVRTNRFKKWFKGSKAIDNNGEPLVVYHGARHAGFDIFKFGINRSNGIYTTPTRHAANRYAATSEERLNETNLPNAQIGVENRAVYPLFINLQNPAIFDFEGRDWDRYEKEPKEYAIIDSDTDKKVSFSTLQEAIAYCEENGLEPSIEITKIYTTTDDLINQAKAEGYDGCIFLNVKDGNLVKTIKNGKNVYIDTPMTDYVAFESNQLKSATENVGTFSGDDRIQFEIEPLDEAQQKKLDELSARTVERISDMQTELPEEMSDAGKLIFATNDRTEGIRWLMERINKFRLEHGKQKMSSIFDVRTRLEAKDNGVRESINLFKNNEMARLGDVVKSLIPHIKKSAIYKKYKIDSVDNSIELTPQEFLERYLIAMDSWESIKLGLPSVGEADFKARMSGTDTVTFANEFQEAFRGQKDLITELHKSVKAISDMTLDMDYEAELITEEQYQTYKAREYYVPERENFDAEKFMSEIDKNYAPLQRGKKIKDVATKYQRKGRNSIATNIFGNLIYGTMDAIDKAYLNKIKLTFYDMLMDNIDFCHAAHIPQPKVVYYKRDASGEIVRYEEGPTKEEIKRFKEIETDIKTLQAQLDEIEEDDAESMDIIKREIDDLERQRPYLDSVDTEHMYELETDKASDTVKLYVKGHLNEIYLPNMTEIALALNDRFSPTKERTNIISQMCGWYSAVVTAKNPAFFTVNEPRDIQTISHKGIAEYGAEFEIHFLRRMAVNGMARKALMNYLRKGTIDTSTDTGQKLEAFLKGGGSTGYSFVINMKKLREEIQQWSDNKEKFTFEKLNRPAMIMNEYAEMITRFSAYCALLDMQKSEIEAINGALNLSANFSRMGFGYYTNFKGKYANGLSWFTSAIEFCNSMSMFANASIQGAAGALRVFVGNEEKKSDRIKHTMRAITSMAVFPFLGGLLSTIISPDDDNDEYRPSDYDRCHNFIWGDLRCVLSPELIPFWTWGVCAGQIMNGRMDGARFANNVITTTITNLIPLSPQITEMFSSIFDMTLGDKNINFATIVSKLFMPQVLQNVSNLSRNENFMGGKLKYNIGDSPEYIYDENIGYMYSKLAEAAYYCNIHRNRDFPSKTQVFKDEDGNVRLGKDILLNWNPKQIKSSLFLIPSFYLDAAASIVGLGAWAFEDAPQGISLTESDKIHASDVPVLNRYYKPKNKEIYRYQIKKEASSIVERYKKFGENAISNIALADNDKRDDIVNDIKARYDNTIVNLEAEINTYNDLGLTKQMRKLGLRSKKDIKEQFKNLPYDKLDEEQKKCIQKMQEIIFMLEGEEEAETKRQSWLEKSGIEITQDIIPRYDW